MNRIFIISIILFQSSLIIAQSIPKDQFLYQSRKLFYDAGRDWESLTVFGPIRYKSKSKQKFKNFKLSNLVDTRLGLTFKNNSYALNGFNQIKYKDHFYAYTYPLIVNSRYESYKLGTEIKFDSSYKSYSGLGFENNWVIVQLGGGKENWGAGNDIQLALSDNSQKYDYILLGSDYGNIRVRYIHGFLENVGKNINRYITARGFEWTNKKSFIIGFSETVIYSGDNRTIDLGYLNPISSHLEVELNNRLNVNGDMNSNAVWQIHLDYLLIKNLRISLNYLYDEFVLDQNIEIGKEHGRALSIRAAYTPLFNKNHIITLNSSLIYVGTPTFRHGVGTNNFVQDGRPLGWYGGSDGQESSIGINYHNNNDLFVTLSIGYLQSGDETITDRLYEPYADYLKGDFPSGQINQVYYAETSFSYYWRNKYSFSSVVRWSNYGNIINLKLNVPLFGNFKN